MPKGLGPLQKKILILLAAPIALGFAYTPGQRAKAFRQFGKEWEKINSDALREAIQGLYKNRLINKKEGGDGKIRLTLLDRGREKILEYKIDEIKIKKPKSWDGKWRMIIFDIPHKKKKSRDLIRFHLKRLGFCQYQKSVFVHPYPCNNEIDFLIEFYHIRPYVRQLVVSYIDNDLHLREIFKKLIRQL